MSLLYFLRRLYSLDTLDTRFTVSSKIPLQQTVVEHAVDATNPALSSNGQLRSRETGDLPPGAQPPKWRTLEYYVYYFLFIVIVPWMFYVPYLVSKESDPEYPNYAPLLSKGWILGRKVDNSDTQYASFRNNIPYMAVLVITHPLLRRIYNHLYPLKLSENVKSDNISALAGSRLEQRVSFDLIFAFIFVFVLHGFSAFKVLLILYINHRLATGLPKKYIPVATWLANIAILFANELCHGYQYSELAHLISPSSFSASNIPSRNWGAWLDSYGGLVPRWEVLFNITILRLVSFNMDYYWSLQQNASNNIEVRRFKFMRTTAECLKKKQLDPSVLSERDRVTFPAGSGSYTFRNYLSYTLYSPLYLAGPIVTFNDYISQLQYPSPSITTTRTVLYGVRFLLALLSMELLLHYIYTVAISKSNPNWSHYSPFQLSMLGYFNLHIIWLKLLLPWRFFRLWSLLDNIDPPENMVRCMSDNYSTLAFWRGWHRSLNRWIIRYLYVPLGGSGNGMGKVRSLLNVLIVFIFVALWHDISLRLLAWSWLIVLFLLPEVVCSALLFPARKYRNKPETYRLLSGVGAVGNILMMMVANLIGFAVGLDGIQGLVKGITNGWQGWTFLLMACGALFVGVMVMFEVREEEKRKGISMKC